MVVDAAAKRSAAAGDDQEVGGQAYGVAYRRPSLPDPYFFSRSGMAVLGDVRAAAQEAIGDVLLSALTRRPETHCGRLALMLMRGDISPAATATALAAMSPAAHATAVRASMGRTMATARELVRDTRSQSYDHLRRVLSVGGQLDGTCPHCDARAEDTYVHVRFECAALHAQRQFVMAHIATHVCRSGSYFWFQPSLRVAYTPDGLLAPAGSQRQQGAEQRSARVREGVRREQAPGLIEVHESSSPTARLLAVFSKDRLECLLRTVGLGRSADDAARLAVDVVADTLAAASEAPVSLVAQLPPAWRKWLARRFDLQAEAAQTPLTFMADDDAFPQPPLILLGSVACVRRCQGDWQWQYDAWSESCPWHQSVLLTLSDDGSEDATRLLGPSGTLYRRIRRTLRRRRARR